MPSKHSIASSVSKLWYLPLTLTLASSGCTQNWWNAFLDPSQTGNFRTNQIVEIQRSISFYDKPLGVPGATDPTPEDLVAYVEEYRIGPGDVLSIRILDFYTVNAETDLTPVAVDELGYVTLRPLGRIHVEGMSTWELEQYIIDLAKKAEIFNEESEPIVVVTVINPQQRVYTISGPSHVVSSGQGNIPRPDFRLREAITAVGGIDPVIKNIYVFRNQPRQKRIREHSLRQDQPSEAQPSLPAPPVSPVFMSETGGGQAGGPDTSSAEPGTRPATRLAVPPEDAERQLIQALEPGDPRSTGPTTAPVTPPDPATSPVRPRWTFVNDRFIEKEPDEPLELPVPRPGAPDSQPSPETQPVDWQDLAQEGQQRIIRIPADKLRYGEPSVDIVIRHQDYIRLETGPVGMFYLNGHVINNGAFSFQGDEITLRQAITSAGGLDPLAWPTRCSITRRIDENREETLQLDLARIMEGKDPDFYLKPNDLVDVGTHAIAPLLATIRNSFRLTYGFGFVYDRNFADIDAYFPQQNPRDVRRSLLMQRFPGLFP